MPYKAREAKLACDARYREKNRAAIAARRDSQGDKIRAQQRDRYHKNPEHFRDQELWRKYKIRSIDYERMLAEQGGKCAVCETCDFVGPGRRLHVDHNHATGKVRGLVCVRCNVLIGMAQEQHERFLAALQYLKKHEQLTQDELLL